MLSEPSSDSFYVDLQKKTLQQMTQAQVQNQVAEIIEKTFQAILVENKVVLSRSEQKRLFAQVTKSILEEVQRKLGLI